MRISDWSSDVCSSDLLGHRRGDARAVAAIEPDGVGQLRRADFASTLARGAMAHSAICLEQRRAARRRRARLLLTDDGAHMADDNVDSVGRASCRAEACQYV